MQLGLCHSVHQVSLARNLGQRLERNLGVTSLTIEADSAPIPEVWDQGSGCDALLLFLDAASVPGPVVRRQWEGLLDHSGELPIAVLRMEPCRYPPLLERRPFLAPGSALEAERWVERWLVEMLPAGREGIGAAAISASIPDEWWADLVDQPGVCLAAAADTDAAQALARAAGSHFQETFWIGCEDRSAAAIVSEIDHWSRGAARLLFVLVHAGGLPLESLPRGRHSYLILSGSTAAATSDSELAPWLGTCQTSGFPGTMMDLLLDGRTRADWEHLVTELDRARGWFRPKARWEPNGPARDRHLAVLEETFRNWRARAPLCRELVGEAGAAIRYGFAGNEHSGVFELCLQLASLLEDDKRYGEAVEWLRELVERAERDGDTGIARRARQQLSWLVDDTGTPLEEAPVEGDQLAFDFGNEIL